MADRASRAERRVSAPDLRAFVPRGSLAWLREHPERQHLTVDGSLVFVDISGFTAMSERLARVGPVGAEEVLELLNHTFSRLLAVAYEDDGSLLKFGGDALLLQFDGPQHCARAVHAAWGMRRKLRELQPLASSAGQVRLRMSVGVHTGEIGQFLVGSERRELLVVGPAASEVVAMESAAGAGQIVVSPAVAACLGPALLGRPVGGGHLLARSPAAPRHRRAGVVREDASAAELLLSRPVRARLASGVPPAEHRPCVIGFVKVLGVDDHLARHGAEATAAALGHLVDALDDACRPTDVCVLASDVDAGGFKFILAAGVPSSQEFDGERMLRTLVAFRDAGHPFALKIGVHSGPVFAGVIGPPFRLTYTIIGDAVNLAARVMGHAEPGTVLATPEVLNRSQALFAFADLPPFAVKGKSQPVHAYRILEVTSERLRRSRARFRLAGRQHELDQLVAAFDAAAAGSGQLVHLVGAAGIGKSRLVDELHERRPDQTVLLATCSSHESTTPYHAIGGLLRSLLQLEAAAAAPELRRALRRLAPGVVELAPLIGDVLGIPTPDNDATRDLAPGFRAERAVDATCTLLATLVAEPAVVVCEDLHWIDPESRKVVERLVSSVLPMRRWVLVLTSRRPVAVDAPPSVGLTVLELEPLGEGEARELVYTAVEEGLLSMERGHELLAKAGGNPFFLQELLLVGGDEAVPDTVDGLMQTQLDLLPPADRQLLSDAAVLGADVDLELLAATNGVSVAVQRATFRRLDTFLEPAGDGFRFRHALVRDGAYRRLPFRRRRELHVAAAAALERRPGDRRADLLAMHTYLARDWRRARDYSLEAGDQAAARFANHTAAANYRHAIESSRHLRDLPPGQVAADWERLGDMLLLGSSYDDAVAAYRSARRLAPAPRQVHLCCQIGQVRERQSRLSEALRWYSRALSLDGQHRTGESGRILVESAIVRGRQGRPAVALRLARDAEAATDDTSTLARVAYVQAWAAMLLGRDGRAEERRALALFEAADDVVGLGLAYNIISMAAYYRGDWSEAAAAYEQAATLRRRVGDEVAAAVALGNLGELLADQGHFERARVLLEDSRAVCAAAGYVNGRLFASMTLGRLDARCGRYEDAELKLKEAHAGLTAIGMGWLVHECQRFLVELALFRGDHRLVVDRARALEEDATLGSTGLRSAALRLRTCAFALAEERVAAEAAAESLVDLLDPDAHDYETGLSLAAAASVLEPTPGPLEARARTILGALEVVADPEVLLFGPTSPRLVGRSDASLATA